MPTQIVFATGVEDFEKKIIESLNQQTAPGQYLPAFSATHTDNLVDVCIKIRPQIVVIREEMVTDAQQDFLKLVRALIMSVANLRVIVITKKRLPGDPLMAGLIMYGIYNIISDDQLAPSDVANVILHPMTLKDLSGFVPDINLENDGTQMSFSAPSDANHLDDINPSASPSPSEPRGKSVAVFNQVSHTDPLGDIRKTEDMSLYNEENESEGHQEDDGIKDPPLFDEVPQHSAADILSSHDETPEHADAEPVKPETEAQNTSESCVGAAEGENKTPEAPETDAGEPDAKPVQPLETEVRMVPVFDLSDAEEPEQTQESTPEPEAQEPEVQEPEEKADNEPQEEPAAVSTQETQEADEKPEEPQEVCAPASDGTETDAPAEAPCDVPADKPEETEPEAPADGEEEVSVQPETAAETEHQERKSAVSMLFGEDTPVHHEETDAPARRSSFLGCLSDEELKELADILHTAAARQMKEEMHSFLNHPADADPSDFVELLQFYKTVSDFIAHR